MKELRSIPAPGYIGSVDRQACADGIFWTTNRYDPQKSSISGPFDSQDDMNKGILQQLAVVEQGGYLEYLRQFISMALHDHKTFFAHGDLWPGNILVQWTSGGAGEKGTIQTKIIDWESAGWYPEYWDYSNTMATSKRVLSNHPEWLEIVQSTMKPYPYQEVIMELIRQCFRY